MANIKSLTTIEKRVLAESPETDISTLEQLAQDSNNYVRKAALRRLQASHSARELPDDWQRLSDHECISRLKGHSAERDVLEVLAFSENWRIRQAVAGNENTPDSLLKLLANDEDSDVRQSVIDRRLPREWRELDDDERIQRLSTTVAPVEVSEILSHSENWLVRQHVASNNGTTKEVLERLSKDEDSDVSEAARETLLALALPEEWRRIEDAERIRRLKETKADTEVLEALASSSNWLIRQAVARHEACPPELLRKLAKDDNSDVRQATIDRDLPLEWRWLDNTQRAIRLSKEDTALEVLVILARSHDWRIRQAVASNACAPAEILQELARDEDSDVATSARDALLSQRLSNEWRALDASQKIDRVNSGQATEEILEILSLSTSQKLRRAVASSLTTPIKCLRDLIEDKDDDVRQAAKESLVHKLLPEEWRDLSDWEIIKRLSQEAASEETLQALAMSQCICIRDAVACNINVSIPILLAMKDDSSTPARIRDLIRHTWATPQPTGA